MNLDELRTAWQATDTQLRATQQLQHQLVHTLVQRGSQSRLATLQRKLTTQAFLLAVSTPLLLAGVLRWNPFGLTTWYGFAPLLLWACAPAVASLLTWQERQRVARLSLAAVNLHAALRTVVEAQQRYLTLLGKLALAAVLLVFALNITRATEHLATMSLAEVALAYGTNLGLAGLFSHWFLRKQWSHTTQAYTAELQTWLAELTELQELHGTPQA
jgi:hypothetical protein